MLINIIATSTTAEQCRVQEAQFSAFLQDVQVNSTSLPWHLLPVEDRQIVHPGKKTSRNTPGALVSHFSNLKPVTSILLNRHASILSFRISFTQFIQSMNLIALY
jgi:hypothetical protein